MELDTIQEVEVANGIDENYDNVIIHVTDLTVWTPEGKSWRRRVITPKTIILNKVTGNIRRGEFAAVIGPSGAGKTTFLVALAGKCTLPAEGAVTVNGTNVKDVQGVVEMVPQFEAFMESLAVMEHLVFMIEMKRGCCKNVYNKQVLNTVIHELKLNALVDTPISALSGGEKRLLSLASSLLSNPQILICDEPTTGLDSYNAALVIEMLKKLTNIGKTVICSVHQPSCDIFKEFNAVMLMAEGKLLFHGSQDDCQELFGSINLNCPMNYNPAEFYIRAVSDRNDGNIERISEKYHDRFSRCRRTALGTPMQGRSELLQRNWFKQVQLLLWRSSLTLKRDMRSHLLQLFLSVVASSLILGTCYVGITGTTQLGVQDVRGFLWLITSEVCFGLSYNALYTFESEITLFRREVGLYKCSAYFVTRFLSFIPRCIVWPIVLVSIATLAVELPNHVVTALELIVALVGAAIAAMAYGLGMAALFTSTGIMGDVMPCADLPLFLMSGAFLRISSMPSWLYPVKYVSHFYYAMDAVSNLYWRQIDHIDCPSNTTSSCIKDGSSVLTENGYSSDFVLQDCSGLLFVTIMWALLGYLGLKREEGKGYAY